jgi:Fe-S-cluster-containing hydrogenase component 2
LARVITEACIGTKDGSCVDVCPMHCIHDDGPEDQILYIEPEQCMDCDGCVAICPTYAIFADDEVPEPLAVYIEINALWYRDKEAARALVREQQQGR